MTRSPEQAGRPTRREELGRLLLETGALTPDWAPSFEAVPRSRFLPDLMWPYDMATGRNLVVDKADDPEAWQRHADSNDPIVTQWDDGQHDGPEPGKSFSVPWGTYYGPGEATARLRVAEDRRSASGQFTRPVAFMCMRSQRLVWPRHDEYVPAGAMEAADTSTTSMTEEGLCGTGSFDAVVFALGLRVPDVVHVADRKRGGRRAVWFYGLSGVADRSWAVVVFRDDRTRVKVYQSGPRRLWNEVEAAHEWWVGQGRPGFPRFGLTVDQDGEHPWLDEPNNLVRVTSHGSR
ncbi:hypothetical protein [Streptomyces noursei]|uniref:hypothetical protein n=1 Tax=Streptomyces noursei TaxID=1971 RepID=UPI0016794006|nr:hypothetical protein [Streptomyces noursei]MCZ1016424.1 hypothetical protein [Streptomyces noursei]GGW99762.1 hypothetical protein GCM10010341_21780 [Streptomyces noursei]